MDLLLKRRFLGEHYTIGDFLINSVKLCEVIEDKVRDLNQDGDLDDPGEDKVYAETAIPYGRYRVVLTMSPKFTRLLPLLLGVKHFDGIRIHRGNRAEDSAGCILPGENKQKGMVLNSTKYEMIIVERILEAMLRGEEVWIDVVKA